MREFASELERVTPGGGELRAWVEQAAARPNSAEALLASFAQAQTEYVSERQWQAEIMARLR
jgi:hypothetical protein